MSRSPVHKGKKVENQLKISTFFNKLPVQKTSHIKKLQTDLSLKKGANPGLDSRKTNASKRQLEFDKASVNCTEVLVISDDGDGVEIVKNDLNHKSKHKYSHNKIEKSLKSDVYTYKKNQEKGNPIEIKPTTSKLNIDLEPSTQINYTPCNKAQIFAITPEKTYLEQDILEDITQISNCFQNSDRKCSPPHSTPYENNKKRKYRTGSPDIIPPTPQNEVTLLKAKSKSKMCIESKFPKSNHTLLVNQNDNSVPDMLVKTPPKKTKSLINREIINLKQIKAGEIDDILSKALKNIENSPPNPIYNSSPKKSSKIAQSTSTFKVTNTKNISPSKMSPHKGQIIETTTIASKSCSKSRRSLFNPNKILSGETDIDPKPTFRINLLKTPPKSNPNELIGYFGDLPENHKERRQVELDQSNYIVINKQVSVEEILDDLNLDHFIDNEIEEQINELNLETWTYCKILEIENEMWPNLILKLQCIDTNLESRCLIQEQWIYSKLKSGDVINIKAIQNNGSIPFTINNDSGFLVFEPDYMLSPTTIVGSYFCRRKGILSERFRGYSPENKVMLVGVLVHQLLQDVLKLKLYELPAIEERLMDILASPSIMVKSFASKISIEELKKDLLPFVSKIYGFVQKYLKGRDIAKHTQKESVFKFGKTLHEGWKGEIDTIEDIEENVWCPQLGMKGKVDVTLKAKPFGNNLPLELKSGRASMSYEHRGQLIIYAMILTELGYDINSGLLLYIREEIVNEVTANHKEKRDLLMLRNEVAYYLTQVPKSTPIVNHVSQSNSSKCSDPTIQTKDILTPAELPEPINHYSACAKCPYATICTTFISQDPNLELSAEHPLMQLSPHLLKHLNQSHIDYFVRWTSLIMIESQYKPFTKELKDIWRIKPPQREKRGHSICHLKISVIIPETAETYLHTFVRASDEDTLVLLSAQALNSNLLQSGVIPGNYVVLSTDARLAVATGYIRKINKHDVIVSLERNLNDRYENKTFHLDTYESQQMISFGMTNLAALLDKNERATRLRELIIDKQQPIITGMLPKSVKVSAAAVLKSLNKLQQRAVLSALTTTDFMLIKGMPGTGKTATIVALIQMLVAENKSVLITSHTHSAVDNVCVRLRDCGVKLLRLGAENRVHPALKDCTESVLTAHCKRPEELAEVYNNAKVVAVTCLGAGHPMFRYRSLDVCIVDESTQVLQSTVIKVLLSAKAFILIGDPEQLPPIVRNPEALRRGMNESLFEHLDQNESTCNLFMQYRMNKIIMNIANIVSYNGQLLSASPTIAEATLYLPKLERMQTLYREEQWLINALSNRIEYSVYAIYTGPTWGSCIKTDDTLEAQEDEEHTMSNPNEVAIVLSLLEACREAGVPADSIGVIAPYRSQVAMLKKHVLRLCEVHQHEEVEVNTVDQYQGRDKDVIIYTCTRSRDTSKSINITGLEILEDKRRLTVAITRAKHKLIIIGDFETLCDYAPFSKLVNSLELHQGTSLKEGIHGFNWTKVLQRLKV